MTKEGQLVPLIYVKRCESCWMGSMMDGIIATFHQWIIIKGYVPSFFVSVMSWDIYCGIQNLTILSLTGRESNEEDFTLVVYMCILFFFFGANTYVY